MEKPRPFPGTLSPRSCPFHSPPTPHSRLFLLLRAPAHHCRSSESSSRWPLRGSPRPQITAITSASAFRVHLARPRRLPPPLPPERSVPAAVAAAASSRHPPPRAASRPAEERLALASPSSTFPPNPRPPPEPLALFHVSAPHGHHRRRPSPWKAISRPFPHLHFTPTAFAASSRSPRTPPRPPPSPVPPHRAGAVAHRRATAVRVHRRASPLLITSRDEIKGKEIPVVKATFRSLFGSKYSPLRAAPRPGTPPSPRHRFWPEVEDGAVMFAEKPSLTFLFLPLFIVSCESYA